LTAENLSYEHLCCIIRSKKPHPGVEAKRQWLSNQSFAMTLVLKPSMLLKTDMDCLHFLLTERHRNLHEMQKKKKSTAKN
jgi:hypothetical protein